MAYPTRGLALEVAHVVDDAIAEAIASQAPSRVLELCEAKKIEADQQAHEARLTAEAERRYAGLSRRDEPARAPWSHTSMRATHTRSSPP